MAIYTHVTLGTNDFENAVGFYDAALGALALIFVILTPSDGNAACSANGGTTGFAAESRDQVNKFHEAGLANGGSDAGEPGPRSFAPNAYASYLRDPDGNKICAYCFAEE